MTESAQFGEAVAHSVDVGQVQVNDAALVDHW